MHLSLQLFLTSILIYGSLLITASPLSSTKIKSSSKVKSYSLPLSHIKKSSTPLTGDALLASLKSNMARVKVKYAANNNLKSTTKSKTASKKVVVTPVLTKPITKATKKQVVVVKPVVKKLSGKKSIKVVNSKIKSRASGEVALTDYFDDAIYTASIQVGTPPISYTVLIDTGSYDLFLFNSSYTPQNSVTSKDLNSSWNVSFVTSGSTGKLFSDQVSLAGVSGSLDFGVAEISSFTLFDGVSGILGLGYLTPNSSSSSNHKPSFLQQRYSKGDLDLPLFAMSVTRRRKSNSLMPGGVINIGSLDSTLYTGAISYVPVVEGWIWAIPLLAIHLNSFDTAISAPRCAIDSGTSIILLPKASAIVFYSKIPGAYEVGNGLFAYPCNSAPSIEFTFGTSRWAISKDDFNLGTSSDSSMCFGAVGYLDESHCLFGDAFMKNVYSVFRFSPPSVGFAQLTGPDATIQPIWNNFVISIIEKPTKKRLGYLQNQFRTYGVLSLTSNFSNAAIILPMKTLTSKIPINLITSKADGKSNNTYLGIAASINGISQFKVSRYASVVLTKTDGIGKDGILDQSSDVKDIIPVKGTSKVWIVGDFDAVQNGYPLSLSF